MNLKIPEYSLVVLIGVSGSGKSTFARNNFQPFETVSSDFCRGLVGNDENDQTVTKEAFETLHFIVSKRLELGNLTVVDATNLFPASRRPLVEIARSFHFIPVAVVIDVDMKICMERNRERNDRNFGDYVIKKQKASLKKSINKLKREGFRKVYTLTSPDEVESVTITREKLHNNKKDDHGPFDLIGDLHGCYDELRELLEKLGYQVRENQDETLPFTVTHPKGRKAVFLGDLADRGPKIVETLKLVMSMHKTGACYCVPGNHEKKLIRALEGKQVQMTHGLPETLKQLEKEPEEFRTEVHDFMKGLTSHLLFDDGKLVAAHAGMKEEMQGRGSSKLRDFAMYGETTGEVDEFGLPIRYNWASDYRGKAIVVYGHTPVPDAEWLNRTICIDTGCVFGGKLTALRYPEKELVSVPALKTYYEPTKPLTKESGKTSSRTGDVLDVDDVLGKKIITTALEGRVTIREENSRAALEVMSRYAVNPRWLVYLPPTMSPSETSKEEDYLEHPAEAINYFTKRGVKKVICEQKHMGSRSVLVLCKDAVTAQKRFGISDGSTGICYTRTGRRFFTNPALEMEFIQRVTTALTKSNLWKKLDTNWICIDAELMPWSVKAQDLIKTTYAAVGSSALAALTESVTALKIAEERGIDTKGTLMEYQQKSDAVKRFEKAYDNYCWPVNSIKDLKLAPFHIMATKGSIHTNKTHKWHMETIADFCKEDEELLLKTPFLEVETDNPESIAKAVNWWKELTETGGEGMVVKPDSFTAFNKGKPLQPAIKCRGREYLRIIYGPDYTLPQNIKRLKKRNLSTKRRLAAKEYALGIEALERFVKKEPLYAVHEAVFGVLAMESEPVDPRL